MVKKVFARTNLAFAVLAVIIIGIVTLMVISMGGDGKSGEQSAHSDHTNRLIKEKSPYLLQHAHNPVDWYPWGEEAFAKAAAENKPVFLSIGYSTCHWCHVMNEESFSRDDVAKLMNAAFVSIKVDREERPDIDNIYMNVAVMMNGSGGWPLTIIMTPDKKPFFAGTYFPHDTRFGQTGMLELIPKVKDAWKKDHSRILKSADKITASLRENTDSRKGSDLDASTLKSTYQQLLGRFDQKNGGFGTQQKFPSPQNLLFLLRYWKRTGETRTLEMVEKTLQAMRTGGMYDHIGFGFHRYSTEPTWRVPHYEKMLYDQALLAMAYTEAFQATGRGEYAETARQTLDYVLRDMTSPAGGFYSAEDADSEGIEGRFYLWTDNEIRRVLSKPEADLFINAFGVDKTRINTLYSAKSVETLAGEFKISASETAKRLEAAREKLFAERDKRIHPHKDDKILADWNGMMIAALAKAGRVFDEAKFNNAAIKAADFVLSNLRRDGGRLLHRFREGEAGIGAHADDYAFFTMGLLELYESTFDTRFLRLALDLTDEFNKYFWDSADGGYFFTAADGEKLLTRQKEVFDNAIPSANSVAMLNLLKLGRLTGNTDYEAKAAALARAFSGNLRRQPIASPQLMSGVDFGIGPSYEVVIVGDPGSGDTKAMLKALRQKFVPNKVVLLKATGEDAGAISDIAEFTRYQTAREGKATAYVCLNFVCNLPTTDTGKMLELLH